MATQTKQRGTNTSNKSAKTTSLQKPQLASRSSLIDKKVVVLTGATSGMGLRILENLAIDGHTVIAVGRDPAQSREALQSARAQNSNANIEFCIADLSIMSQVRILAQDIIDKLKKLKINHIDVIYHNAAQMTKEVEHTYEGHEVQWATNYLSVVLLTELLHPYLKKSEDARIIVVTNKPSKKQKLDLRDIQTSKNPRKLYEYSKLADLMFAMQYNEEFKEENVRAFAVYPGNVRTEIAQKHLSWFRRWLDKLSKKNALTINEGVRTSMYLITASHLPAKVVLYHNYRPIMPCDYALSPFNRERLWRATRNKLGLEQTSEIL